MYLDAGVWRLEQGIGSLSARFPSGCEPPLWVLGTELESSAKVDTRLFSPEIGSLVAQASL